MINIKPNDWKEASCSGGLNLMSGKMLRKNSIPTNADAPRILPGKSKMNLFYKEIIHME
jgi:hypothetical protein